MGNPASPQYQGMAELQRRQALKDQALNEHAAMTMARKQQYEQAQGGYYKSLKEQYGEYSELFPYLRDKDYLLIDAIQPAIEAAAEAGEDAQFLKERAAAASMYSNLFQIPIETAFQNLEEYHQQWVGQPFAKKSGVQAVADSLKLNFVSAEYNKLAKKLADTIDGDDPDLVQAVQEHERTINRLRDHAPKPWQEEYVKMGGWHDVGQWVRGISTMTAENAGYIVTGMAAAGLAATGVGAIAGVAGLSSATSSLLVAGASRAAIAVSTYNQTRGIKYMEMKNEGIPHDIAAAYSKMDAAIEGIIEGALGGVEAAGAKTIASAIVPKAVGQATSRFFISGKMSLAARATLNWLKEGFEEGSGEFFQGISSGNIFNLAADKANERRKEKLREIVRPLFVGDIQKNIEKELENYPMENLSPEIREGLKNLQAKVRMKEWDEILREAWDGAIGGFLTGLVIGVPGTVIGWRNDTKAAVTLARMAQIAPNEAVFKEAVSKAEGQGFNLPVEGELKTDEKAALLSDIYKVQQERLTPEQREAKQRAAQDAGALSEVTDYKNAGVVERVTETEETDTETGEKARITETDLATPDGSDIYRENDRLEIAEYTDTNEDGSVNGRFVAGDPRINDEDQSGANQYGYINYTENENTVTIDEFKMLSGYENLRQQLFNQFAEKFAGRDIVWNPKHEQNTAIRDQLISQNQRGPKAGLNYYEKGSQPNVSNEARQVAQRFTPYMKKSTPLEVALAAEVFNSFYRRRGESISGAMNRLGLTVTNKASDDVIAAQREGKIVKGATWPQKTAEGLKNFVYLNKHAADSSTVIHELAHIVEKDFTDAERRIAARALNGYELKDGTTVYFDENGGHWTDEQHEAFSEGLENFLTNGTAPNEQIKGLFEKIKEFMKRIYKTMKGWTELSPQVEEFYQSLLSGELVDQARAETASQTREEATAQTQTEKTVNDTQRAGDANTAPQEAATAVSPNATQSHTEPQQRREAIINDPDVSLEEKAQAVLDAAGEALYQAGEEGIEDPGKIREMAVVPRDAQTLTEAETIVRDKEKGFLNRPISNFLFDITATISGKSLSEMTSEDLTKKAASPRLQAKAVANADVLFERAIIHTAHPDTHNRENIRQVHRFGAMMEDGGEYVPVKLTVIEYVDERTGNRLYAIEAVDIEKMKSAGLLPQARTNPEIDGPIADFNNRLIQLSEIVNTHDADNSILFQLSEEEQETIDAAKAVYGTTSNFREAGYLLTDGTMLDLSGKNDGGPPGSRHLDHREMNYFEQNGKVYQPGMDGFMAMGNIRLKPEIGGIELNKLPSREQLPTLRRYIQYFNGDVTIDFSKENLDVENSIEYSGTNPNRVINDIINYYEKGIVPEQKDILFQFGDREMMEEAADFEDGKDYRGFIEAFGDLPQELEGLTEKQIDAWFDKFVEKSKQAVNATEEQAQETGGKPEPKVLDAEFIEEIGQGRNLEDFVEIAAALYNNDGRYGPLEEEDTEAAETIHRKLGHPSWQSVFMAKGQMGQTQRKQLLSMIRHSPRDYRAIYAEVMGREDLSVSPEDMTAEILKHKITDSRRQDIDSLTPERLRQLSQDIDVEDFAKKVDAGRAEFLDPIEKEYIKRLKDEVKKADEALKEMEADRLDDNNYIERLAGKEFTDKFEKALKAREDLNRRNEKLDRAIKTGERDVTMIAWQIQRGKSNYDSIVRNLQALARTHQLDVDVQAALMDERVRDAAKAARTETKAVWESKYDKVKEEYKDFRKSAKTQATLLRKVVQADLKAHIAELKEQQKTAQELTKARRGIIKRIFRKISPQKVNAEQGATVAIIQRFAEPSVKKGLNKFIGEIVEHDLRPVFEMWKTDEKLRAELLKDKWLSTQKQMEKLFSKEQFEDLTDNEKKYLARKIAPADWVKELGLKEIFDRRNENYPISENEKQLVQQILPPDVYYRIMDKPFSAWELNEAEELAKIIDDLTVRGKEIYKANIDAEQRRIKAYQADIVKTIRTVKPGTNGEDAEKILGKYKGGEGGTAEGEAKRRSLKGPLQEYANMNVFRFARMLDNGDTNGKNSAALYRSARDALNQKLTAVDARTDRVFNSMENLGITQSELWQKTVELDLGGDMGIRKYTAAEQLGFLSAIRNDYSCDAVMFGNFLSEHERGPFQRKGLTSDELAPMIELAKRRFGQMEQAAHKLIAENPNYQQLLNTIDEDFATSGKRVSEALLWYNNTVMPKVEHYFRMSRTDPVSSHTADAQLASELMGSSSGAFNLYVEKGFTQGRVVIPAQYQTGIKLDILGVWAEAVESEEHFIAFAQPVKDLNKIYKQSRQVRDTIQRRHGSEAVEFIDKYINELVRPKKGETKNALDTYIKKMRGNAAAAYLSFNVTSIIKQGITSPAPFMGYMNPIEYAGTLIEYATHKDALWDEICELSPYMKHRSANMMVEMVKEQAKQRFENKADAAINKFTKFGMQGLEWIDQTCVAPGWLVLFRKEHNRLTNDPANANMSERDIRVKAAQYADDITSITQPSGYSMDIPPLFKGNSELGKAYLQFTQSLSNIYQTMRYDVPQMIRDKRYKNAAGSIIGYTIAGILVGAITEGFDDDDDEEAKAKKLALWATSQFTESLPVIGSEVAYLAELIATGKGRYSSGANLFPAFQKINYAAQTGIKGIQQGEFDKLLKAAALAAEGAAIYKGLPVSGSKTVGRSLGIGDGDGKLNFNPGAVIGRH